MAKRRFERPDSPAVEAAEATAGQPAIPWRSSSDDVPLGVGLRAQARNVLAKHLRLTRPQAAEIVGRLDEEAIREVVRSQLADDARDICKRIAAAVGE
jgi:hypothetical protein